MQLIAWLITLFALYGTLLNANQNRVGFYYWIVTDVAFATMFFVQGMYAQSTLFGVYTYLAIKGLRTWKK